MPETGMQAVALDFARRGGRVVAREEGLAYVRECFGMYIDGLRDAIHTSVNATNDLFDLSENVPQRVVAEFRDGRTRWLAEYERALRAGYQRRIIGHMRTGRRTDAQTGSATIQLLDPLDQTMQIALIGAVRKMQSVVGAELSALAPRMALALNEKYKAEFDNPFDPQYLMDAIGAAARSIYSTPSVWRALMQRVVNDVTPVLHKIYIAQNRFLADRNVLPDIKAWLRNRSRHRPNSDRDVVAAFRDLYTGRTAGGHALPRIRVPNVHVGGRSRTTAANEPLPGQQAGFNALSQKPGGAPRAAPGSPSEQVIHGLLVTAIKEVLETAAIFNERSAVSGSADFPSVDVLLAKGVSRDLVAILGQLQRIDLTANFLATAPLHAGKPIDASHVPLNLIPHVRAALDPKLLRPENVVAMDFVGLLFDYIFEDPSIPGTLHNIFVRLEFPVLKAALLDNEFFVDYAHPARKLLDDLAEASIGASNDPDYFNELHTVASEVVDQICTSYRHDSTEFDQAATMLRRFMADDERRTSAALAADIAAAVLSERRELARSEALSMIRTRLAGIEVPPRVRSFIETVWVDYVADLKRKVAQDDPRLAKALRTLEDLLWTISAKERHAQRKRLCELIPSLISELRRGCVAVNFPAERTRAFMNELYELHREVIENSRTSAAPAPAAPARARAGEEPAHEEPAADGIERSGVFDFVCEMIIGTWIDLISESKVVTMRLSWASPLRTRYVFSSRGQTRAWVFTPEEIALDIECGRASIKLEPVPLVDRAVNAAFDTLGAPDQQGFRKVAANGN